MAAQSDYLESKLLNHIFRDTAFAQPATIAIALCTVAPVDADTGDLTGKEVTGVGYVRMNIGRADANWTAVGVDGTTKNVNSIIWPVAGGDWGDIGWVAIVDNATIGFGNLLFHGALVAHQVVSAGGIFEFAANQLAIQIDD